MNTWASVREQVPPANERVLLTDGKIIAVEYGSAVEMIPSITHWMPLPAPPESIAECPAISPKRQ